MRKFLAVVVACALTSSVAYLPLNCLTPAFAKKKTGDNPNTEDPSVAQLNIGLERIKKGDFNGAVDSLLQSVYFARNNYAPVSYFWLGFCYGMLLQDTKAIEACKKNVEQSIGGVPETHCMLAELYMRNDRDQEAEDECKTALTEFQGPGFKAHCIYGKLLEKRGDFASAQWHYENALGDQPWTYTEAWLRMAECMMKQKNWGGAVKQLGGMIISSQKGILKGLDFQKVYLDLGICLLAKGDHQGAIDNWHKVLGLNFDNPEAHLQLAMLLDAENHMSSAIKEYREFIRVSTDQKKVAKAKERLGMLELKVAPPETASQETKMSPYMRKQVEEQEKQVQQQEEQRQQAIPKDSGF